MAKNSGLVLAGETETPSPPATNDSPPATNDSAPSAPIMPEGFALLSNLRGGRKAQNDPYASLRPFIGKHIALNTIKIEPITVTTKTRGTGELVERDSVKGTATVFEFDPGNPNADSATRPNVDIEIPLGSIRTIAEAVQAGKGKTIVALVVETKRGIALR